MFIPSSLYPTRRLLALVGAILSLLASTQIQAQSRADSALALRGAVEHLTSARMGRAEIVVGGETKLDSLVRSLDVRLASQRSHRTRADRGTERVSVTSFRWLDRAPDSMRRFEARAPGTAAVVRVRVIDSRGRPGNWAIVLLKDGDDFLVHQAVLTYADVVYDTASSPRRPPD